MNRVLLFVFTLLMCSSAVAADVTVVPTEAKVPLVIVSGELEAGDGDIFSEMTGDLTTAAILLEGPGGVLTEGLEIGRTINSRGFATGVAPNTVCASACALAWAAGSPRYMAPSSLIGFHAAWEDVDGQAMTSGVGNALVGAYLTKIGFQESGIVFATSAGPDGMQWLDFVLARTLGIAVQVLADEDEVRVATADPDEPFPLQLPSGYRWVVLASSRSAAGLPDLAAAVSPHPTMIAATSTGYYALITGPFTQEAAEGLLSDRTRNATVPPDAYLSSGNGFVGSLQVGER